MRGFVPTFTPGRTRHPTPWSTVPVAPSAPDTPSSPSPSDTGTAYTTLLSWVSARQATADIYIDTVTPPVALAVPKYNGTSYVPSLLPGTRYYWKIVAFNAGGSTTGPVWSFTTPAATAQIVTLNGAVTTHARVANSTASDLMNAQPNTASIVFDTTPTVGQAVQIGIGTLDAANLVFSGEIQRLDQTYVDTTGATLWPTTCIDWTFQLNQRRPFGSWVNVSATTIAQALIASYASGFTAGGVQAGLPAVSINFDGSADFASCMTALATACGGYYGGPDYSKSIQLTLAAAAATATPITNSNPPLNEPQPIDFSTDLSQVRTRVYGKGFSSTTLTDLPIGEFIIPLGDASQFTVGGGKAIAGRTSGAAQVDILSYTDVQLGGPLAAISTGDATFPTPSAITTAGQPVTPVPGSMAIGTYQYKVAFGTATGIGPASAAKSGSLGSPSLGVAPSATAGTSGSMDAGTHSWAYTYVTASGESAQIGSSTIGVSASGSILFTNPTLSDARVVAINYYVSKVSAGTCFFAGQAKGSGGTFLCTVADASMQTVQMPSSPGTTGWDNGTINLSGIPTSTDARVTSRVLYRTSAGGSIYQQLAVIPDNSTTTYSDNTASASGAAPLSTSAVAVPIGATSFGVSDTSGLPDAAYIQIGSNIIRYTGRSATSGAGNLTGIPTSGGGSITTAIPNGSAITLLPALLGVNAYNGLFSAIAKGSTVAIWVQRDNLSAQAALAALEGTDGIREYLITDGRMSEPLLTATCDADLATFASPIVSATYYTRDTATKAGRTVSIALTANAAPYGLTGTFTIQRVDFTFDGPALYPLRKVTASSTAFTLQDLLRRVALT